MNNDWMTRNSMAEYDRRLREIENERRARKVAARQPRANVMRAALSNVGEQMVALGQRLQQTGGTPAHAHARR